MRTLAERPPWDWGLHLRVDRLPHRQFTRVLPVIIEGVLPNLRRNPSAVIKAALLAWRADLRTELAELRRRELPVVILWGEGDKVMPAAALTVLRGALGDAEVIVVPGSHNWLLADPTAFCEVMTNVVGLAEEIEQEPLRPVS
jgi:pimeloyl-ACP methyl ester carboxylesterase